ncbi:MAG: alkaline phosphatase [Chthoniobacter sp.]|jgi:alkaline phosphatase D|nr:alkaline phosphatase [Chthoniobacter sp.]
MRKLILPRSPACGLILPGASGALTRRSFLRIAGTSAGAFALGFPAIVRAAARSFAFQHGIASGDPLPDRAIIWTRVTPEPEATPGSGLGKKAVVTWQVSRDPMFGTGVATGEAKTAAEQDHTVKVDVGGLQPSTTYYYRFLFKNAFSAVGRFRTAPAPGAMVSSLRFGLASCANFEGGYFSAYRHLAARTDLDFILHVGDYIYEYQTGAYGPGPAIGRTHDPMNEIVTLRDYRRRHAQHKTDADLQALHAVLPFICTWDDHELADDAWNGGAANHQPATEGDFFQRRSNALRAYFEWMPIRPPSASTRLYRQFQFGGLADLSMLDLRQYRDRQPASTTDPAKDDPARVIVGREQLDWLKGNLSASRTRWKLVGNPVMITPVDFRQPLAPEVLAKVGALTGVPFNVDAWDGYTDDRRELLDHLAGNAINNVAFLTGDIHSSWACNVPRGPGSAPSVAVELVGTSITSDNLNEALQLPPRSPVSLQTEAIFQAGNPHVKYLEFDSHGYSVVDVTAARLQMDWYYISERSDPLATQRFAAAFQVRVGTNQVEPAAGPLPRRV